MKKIILFVFSILFVSIGIAQREIDLEIEMISPEEFYYPEIVNEIYLYYPFEIQIYNNGPNDFFNTDTLHQYITKNGDNIKFSDGEGGIIDYKVVVENEILVGESIVISYPVYVFIEDATDDWAEFCFEFYGVNGEDEIQDLDITNNRSCVTILESVETSEIVEESFGSVEIYPNPATDYVYLHSHTSSKVLLTSITGQKIELEAENQKVDVRHVPSGIYFITIKTDNAERIEKLIIR